MPTRCSDARALLSSAPHARDRDDAVADGGDVGRTRLCRGLSRERRVPAVLAAQRLRRPRLVAHRPTPVSCRRPRRRAHPNRHALLRPRRRERDAARQPRAPRSGCYHTSSCSAASTRVVPGDGTAETPGLGITDRPMLLAVVLVPILAFIVATGLHQSPLTLYDSLSYHLFFPARWLQEHRLSIVPTPFSDEAQAYAPANGELFFLWLMLPFHGDLLARIGQLPFYLLGRRRALRAGAPSGRRPGARDLSRPRSSSSRVRSSSRPLGADVDLICWSDVPDVDLRRPRRGSIPTSGATGSCGASASACTAAPSTCRSSTRRSSCSFRSGAVLAPHDAVGAAGHPGLRDCPGTCATGSSAAVRSTRRR